MSRNKNVLAAFNAAIAVVEEAHESLEEQRQRRDAFFVIGLHQVPTGKEDEGDFKFATTMTLLHDLEPTGDKDFVLQMLRNGEVPYGACFLMHNNPVIKMVSEQVLNESAKKSMEVGDMSQEAFDKLLADLDAEDQATEEIEQAEAEAEVAQAAGEVQ